MHTITLILVRSSLQPKTWKVPEMKMGYVILMLHVMDMAEKGLQFNECNRNCNIK